MMDRRTFVTLGAGVFLLGPLATQAQRTRKIRTIGWLSADPQVSPQYQAYFTTVMRSLGWVEGADFVYANRFGDSRPERLSAMVVELVQMNCNLIIALGTEAPLALKQATTVIPIVIVSAGDPVANGLVRNLARPGGNITGLVFQQLELAQKQVELLTQAFPDRTRLAVLFDGQSADQFAAAERAAKALNLQVQALRLENPPYDFDAAFRSALSGGAQIALVLSSPFFLPELNRVVELAKTHRLPAMFIGKHWAEAGGLMSYGADFPLMYRRAADYVAKILKGTKAADLPVEQATKFELIVNLKTARAIGIELPTAILLRADEVIE